jgi:hypothetical protein
MIIDEIEENASLIVDGGWMERTAGRRQGAEAVFGK